MTDNRIILRAKDKSINSSKGRGLSKYRTGTLLGGGNKGRDELSDEYMSEMALLAIRQSEEDERRTRFIADMPGSEPNAQQRELITSFAKYEYKTYVARGGNQCLLNITLVKTPRGHCKIEDLKVGDYVLGPNNEPIMVLAVHDNGVREVFDYVDITGTVWFTCTPSHKFLTQHDQVEEIQRGKFLKHIALRPGRGLNVAQSGIGRQEHVFNITVDHPDNLYQLANGLISKNSGKSVTCCYLVAHLLLEDLPGWKRRPKWHKAPLLILWLGAKGAQIEESLWAKTRPHLPPSSFKEHRQGASLHKVTMKNGNTLLFQSYSNINEATIAVQSFTGHYVFLDELPGKAKLIEESLNRILVNEGLFMAAFTPKRPSPEVKRLLTLMNPETTMTYRLSVNDNPGISAQALHEHRLEAAAHGEKMMKAILEGDWVESDNAVFYIDEEQLVRDLPSNYSASTWRHMESSDPAVASGFGFLLMAEDPATGLWYVIKAKVLSGAQIECDSVSVQTIKKLTAGYLITRRYADSAAANYRRTARLEGLVYSDGINKQDDFWNMISIVQQKMGRQIFITPEALDLLDQLASYCTSDDNPEHIINRKKFHLVDAFRYGVLQLPKFTPVYEPEVLTNDEWMLRTFDNRHTPSKREQSFEKHTREHTRAYQQAARVRPWGG